MTTKYSIMHTTFVLTGRKKVSKKLMKELNKKYLRLILFSLGKSAFSFLRNENVTSDRENITNEIANYLYDNGYEFRVIYYTDKQLELTKRAYNKALIDKYILDVLDKSHLSKVFVYTDWTNQTCIVPLTAKQFAFDNKIKRELNECIKFHK